MCLGIPGQLVEIIDLEEHRAVVDVDGVRREINLGLVMGEPGGTVTAAKARFPTITGWTNSTATWWAWKGHAREAHHMVPPAEKRRARASEARARSSATPPRPASGPAEVRVTLIVSSSTRAVAGKGRAVCVTFIFPPPHEETST